MTTEAKEGRGTREGGVGLESEGGGEEIGSSKVGGDEGGVCLTTVETRGRRMVGRGDAPGVTKVGGDAEFIPPKGGGGGAERSSVGPFRESMEGHVWGEGEDREVVGTT